MLQAEIVAEVCHVEEKGAIQPKKEKKGSSPRNTEAEENVGKANGIREGKEAQLACCSARLVEDGGWRVEGESVRVRMRVKV